MQLVPIIPQQKFSAEESLEVKGIAAVRPVKPVEERTLPPLVTHGHGLPLHASSEISQHEKRQVAVQEERRFVCRRIQHLPVLEELRSSVDRRRHNLRSADFQLHIDEEV